LLELLRRSGRRLFRELALALFNEGGKSDRPIVGNFDAWRGTSDTHGGDRRVDLHIAGFRDLAGDKSEGSLGQIEQGGIRRAAWVVDELVQNHARVARQVERGAIGEVDADLAVGARCYRIALIDEIAHFRLTCRTGGAGLNDHGARPFKGDRARGDDDFSNGFRCDIQHGGLGGIALCVNRAGEKAGGGQDKTSHQYGKRMRAHDPLLPEKILFKWPPTGVQRRHD